VRARDGRRESPEAELDGPRLVADSLEGDEHDAMDGDRWPPDCIPAAERIARATRGAAAR
jgi:hypothetical protein